MQQRITTEQYRAMQASEPKIHTAFWKDNIVWNKEKKAKKTNPEDKVWAAFSAYIRTRDCLATFFRPDIGRCCTCHEAIPKKGNDAGHFLSRGYTAIKYDERNCHLQCVKCNRFQQGNWDRYYTFMIGKYGQSVIDELMGMKNQVVQGYRDYEAEAFFWREKTKILQKDFDNKIQ